jgi:hypothetical protein
MSEQKRVVGPVRGYKESKKERCTGCQQTSVNCWFYKGIRRRKVKHTKSSRKTKSK